MSVSANVRSALAYHGIKQKEIAKLLGVTQNTISRKLLGKNQFKPDEIVLISQKTGETVERLMTGGAA